MTHSPTPASRQLGESWNLSFERNPLFTKTQTGRYYASGTHTLIFLPTSMEGYVRHKNIFLCLRIEVRLKSRECSGHWRLWDRSQLDGTKYPAPNSQWMAPWQPQTPQPEGENSLGGGTANPVSNTLGKEASEERNSSSRAP